MINLTIDGYKVSVPEGTTIMKAAASIGIEIPHLCYLEGVNEIGACKVCVVELKGSSKLIASCNSPAEEGMEIYTNSLRVRRARRTNVELLLSQHDCFCATCVRSGNCALQKLSNDLGILEIPFRKEITNLPWNRDFPLIRDNAKCIKCMRCVSFCSKIQGMNIWDVENTGSRTTVDVVGDHVIEHSDCTLCGQCITHCPTGALRERDDTDKVYDALEDPDKITVVQVAPAVRSAWAEQLGLTDEEATVGRMVASLKRLGFDYVFDTNYSADLTIMEEGSELLERLKTPDRYTWPMFTSCCPGWVSFVAKRYPNYLKNLSTAKSPQQMFGAITKTYFAKKLGIDPKKIFCISIMPCTSKKREAALPTMSVNGEDPDVDVVLTTREFARMVKADHITPAKLPDENFDLPLGEGTGAAVIFGVTGGVMEAALRTAYAVVEGKNPDPDAFSAVRGMDGRREADITIGMATLHTCTVTGLGNAEKLMQDIESGKCHYDFVEVMACPGGCVGGGGQPIHESIEFAKARGEKLYALDRANAVRFSHENKSVSKTYAEYLDKPLGHKSHEILHTNSETYRSLM